MIGKKQQSFFFYSGEQGGNPHETILQINECKSTLGNYNLKHYDI